MGPHPPWWEVADHELEERVVGLSDHTHPNGWRLMYGQQIDTTGQAVGFSSNTYGHNRWAWPRQ